MDDDILGRVRDFGGWVLLGLRFRDRALLRRLGRRPLDPGTRARLPSPRQWWCLYRRFERLHTRHWIRAQLGDAGGADPRIHEEAGYARCVMWRVRAHAGVDGRRRLRVWLLTHPRVGVQERWVNAAEDACAWVLVAHLEPAWVAITLDGDEPWPLLAAFPRTELADAWSTVWPCPTRLASSAARHRLLARAAS